MSPINLLLADDDDDDCLFFRDALEELPFSANLTTVHNGEQLMQYLEGNATTLPDVLYLDLNMPRKNGYDCLYEIKKHEKLKQIPVVIFSTSFYSQGINELQQQGAQYYIRKPASFSDFKKVILESLMFILEVNGKTMGTETFTLTPI